MDLVHDRASIINAEEDRISKLSDDIIHLILSFVDMEDAIRTSQLSRRWKLIWTTMPHLELDTSAFRHLLQFAKFVKHALSHRNNASSVSSVKLEFTGVATQFCIKSIINYAFSHHVNQMNLKWDNPKSSEIPQCLFSSHTLKNLTVTVSSYCASCFVPESGWDFPALETLSLSNIKFTGGGTDKSLNPFPKCVNLKNLTLDRFEMYNVGIFIIYAPQLSNLTITNACRFPEVVNVVAPQLQNLTASLTIRYGFGPCSNLKLLTGSLNSLEKVDLSLYHSSNASSYAPWYKDKYVPLLLDVFDKLQRATTLILDIDIIQTISSNLDKFSHEPCSFSNLECLKVQSVSCDLTHVKNYLLENSPSATFIVDSSQVSQKRSWEPIPDDGMTNKVAKIPTQDEVIAELRAKIKILETTNCQYYEFVQHIILGRLAELKLQVESGNPDYEVIHSMGRKIRSLIHWMPECSRKSMETYISAQYNEVKHQSPTYINPREWAEIETQMGFLTDSERLYSNNILIRSDVLTTNTAPTPSSANVPQKRSREPIPDDGMTNKVAKLEAENKQAETTDKEKITLKAKIPTQDEVIAEQRAKIKILETTNWQYYKLIQNMIYGKMAKLTLQVQSGNPDYEVIRSMGREIKSLIDLMPECSRVYMETFISARFKEVKAHTRTCITPRRWAQIETQMGFLPDSERLYSNNILIRSDVLTTDTAPTPSSTNMATSSEEGAK